MSKDPEKSKRDAWKGKTTRRGMVRTVGGISVLSLGALQHNMLRRSAAAASDSNGSPNQITTLPNPDPDEGDSFGSSLAVSEDGSTALVGNYRDSTDGRWSGQAYIFERTHGDQKSVRSVTLLNPNPDPKDAFGASVSLSGDGSTALVGATGEEAGQNARGYGSAYLFNRTERGWDTANPIELPNPRPQAENRFGAAVSLSDDGRTALIGAFSFDSGAYEDDDTGRDTGKAYIFTKSRDGWNTDTPVTLENPTSDASDTYGRSVSLSGDGSAAIVSAWGSYVDGRRWVGEAYLFERNAGSWESATSVTLPHPNPHSYDYFGRSLSLSRDGSTALVGASHADTDTEHDVGKAFVFNRKDNSWNTESPVVLSNPDADHADLFGISLALGRNGMSALISSSGEESDNNDNVEGVHLIRQTEGSWENAEAMTLSNPEPDKRIYAGTVDFDGSGSVALFGADQEAYLYSLSGKD